jgi:hypothetical protein
MIHVIRIVVGTIFLLLSYKVVRLLYEPAKKKALEDKYPILASHPQLFGWGIVCTFLVLYLTWTVVK